MLGFFASIVAERGWTADLLKKAAKWLGTISQGIRLVHLFALYAAVQVIEVRLTYALFKRKKRTPLLRLRTPGAKNRPSSDCRRSWPCGRPFSASRCRSTYPSVASICNGPVTCTVRLSGNMIGKVGEAAATKAGETIGGSLMQIIVDRWRLKPDVVEREFNLRLEATKRLKTLISHPELLAKEVERATGSTHYLSELHQREAVNFGKALGYAASNGPLPLDGPAPELRVMNTLERGGGHSSCVQGYCLRPCG
ncbi:MAG: hypothetical protein EON58_23420 [Alphaproteobacteria bacterium]|nr:MAG: hypothetical protein EON58_23420 [Alphaproteobacteria bacterium]